jgi:alkylation response protein AidB-like acyl-CoA dehydrogenase
MGARDLPEDERAIVETVARWVDREVRPQAGRLEREQRYPAALIDQMKGTNEIQRTVIVRQLVARSRER